MSEITVHAPAKINLCLHVTGQRADGYHLLDTLVAFCTVGDVLTLRPGPLSLALCGPEAAALSAEPDNLILRAARMMGAEAAITLDKRLPVASGLGGGSADAAAALRGLARLTGRPLPGAVETLGADVPMCLAARPARVRGIGERLTPVRLPALHLVLVNPRVPVATPAVFAALERRDGRGLPEPLPDWPDAAALVTWLAGTRNDLEPPARRQAPAIAEALTALEGALFARMSGSGATCFGIFGDAAQARAAADDIRRARPGWWVVATQTGAQAGVTLS